MESQIAEGRVCAQAGLALGLGNHWLIYVCFPGTVLGVGVAETNRVMA